MRCVWTSGKSRIAIGEVVIASYSKLIEKSTRQVVLFIDDAHRLQAQTLAGLKGLVEKQLGVV
jgi:type II secretory pathway predicted ATPase ExeA